MTTDVREAVAPVLPAVADPDSGHPTEAHASARASSESRSSVDATDESRWARVAPLLLVAFAVGFTAWCLRSELRVVPYGNDAAGHAALVHFAEQRIRSGHNPFDAWYPYLGLGAPQFTQYQTLSHIVTAMLSIVFGGWMFRAENYALLCTLPVSVYVGARLLGLDRWQAGAAALFTPMLSNVTGYGIEWKSFVWIGNGMSSMLWGVWLLPIALGLAWRAVSKGERIALAAFVVGLTCAVHFLTGYLVLLAFIVFVLVRPPDLVYRLGRSAIVGLGGLAIFAFVFVPALEGIPFMNVNAFDRGTFWFDSYGPHKVFSWLFRGQVFDSGRLPVVSVLVAVGTVLCLARVRRREAARVPVGLMALSLALYSGRSVVGPVVNYLPGGGSLFLHRYIMGVHFAGLLLAGIGGVWVVRFAASLVGRMRRSHAVRIVLLGVLIAAVMYPVLANRAHFARTDTSYIDKQAAIGRTTGRDVTALITIAKQRGDGRIYAGGSNGWGYNARFGQVALYVSPIQQAADSFGWYSATDSLSSDVEPFFDETDPAQYDLFNVKYVLLQSDHPPAIPNATRLATRGDYTLYEVPTSGYLEAVDTTAPVSADRSTVFAEARTYLKSSAVAEHRHPFVSFNGSATPAPSIPASSPDIGAPGSVVQSHAGFDDGRFSGTVHMTRPAWVMLKESYAPGWTATVDGKPATAAMLAPSFVGVAVPAGDHEVAFVYRQGSSYPTLFTIGGLTLLGLVLVPRIWRRRRASRLRALQSA